MEEKYLSLSWISCQQESVENLSLMSKKVSNKTKRRREERSKMQEDVNFKSSNSRVKKWEEVWVLKEVVAKEECLNRIYRCKHNSNYSNLMGNKLRVDKPNKWFSQEEFQVNNNGIKLKLKEFLNRFFQEESNQFNKTQISQLVKVRSNLIVAQVQVVTVNLMMILKILKEPQM